MLASKYGGGAEIVEEMYRLTDRGKRDLALRYDLTIPFAKVVAMNPTLRLPFKRYKIGKVFREGPIKTGRFRKFTQCDVDMVGVDSQLAEAELMIMALDAFNKLVLKVTIQYEILLSNQSIKSSIGSGGRYDNEIGGLLGLDKEFSTVGISFGLDVIYTAMSLFKENRDRKSDVDYYVVSLNTKKEAFLAAGYLRSQGFKVEFELSDKKIGKALDKVNKENIDNVNIIGEDEVKKNQYIVKNMLSGVERIESFQYRLAVD